MLPTPRGEITEALLGVLVQDPDLQRSEFGLHELRAAVRGGPAGAALGDEDLQLALYVLYELHYRGLAGVAEEWEWHAGLLAVRSRLEERFLAGLRVAVPPRLEDLRPATQAEDAARTVDLQLRAIADADAGPSLSHHIRTRATLQQVREFLIHRSAYQLKEADPHSWALPRLFGPPKAALVEIQYDEYGGGRAECIHASLFAQSMRALGLDDGYGTYLDLIPGLTLATVNLMSMFGLHRRWRGAIVGHLALFEMTSSLPNRRYAQGLRRLGLDSRATRFFDEHVTADAVHENIASVDLAGGLLRQEPQLLESLLWGARTLAHLEALWAERLLMRWGAGVSSLLRPLPDPPPQPGALAEPQLSPA
jgi:hypothetical protein